MALRIIEVPSETDKTKVGFVLKFDGKDSYVVGNDTFINLSDDDMKALKLWAMDQVIKDLHQGR